MSLDIVDTTAPRPARLINLIVVHCSATPSGKRIGRNDPGNAINAAQVIDGWHRERGFLRKLAAVVAYNRHLPHIGYHYVVDISGFIFTGRSQQEVGAHVSGHNANSLGICLIGGAEPRAAYTVPQWKTLEKIVGDLRRQFPAARVVGHRDLSPDANGDGQVQPREWLKTCPGFDVQAWVESGYAIPEGQAL